MYDENAKRLVVREIEYTPALYKIFDEILVNATDHKQRCKTMKRIAVTIDPDRNEISVFNDGAGIPVRKHKSWGTYVIEGIFGHLLCGSNFNDNEAKTTGGRNGYGAKLTNVYSKRFEVETYSFKDKKRYKQVWKNNMSECSNPVIKDIAKSALKKSSSFTKITFRPDLKRFKMTKLDDDIVALMTKRCYDAAAVSHCEVTLNGVPIEVKSFEQYVFCFVFSRKKKRNKQTTVQVRQDGSSVSSCRAEQDRVQNNKQTMGNCSDTLTGLFVQADKFCKWYCDNKRRNTCQSHRVTDFETSCRYHVQESQELGSQGDEEFNS